MSHQEKPHQNNSIKKNIYTTRISIKSLAVIANYYVGETLSVECAHELAKIISNDIRKLMRTSAKNACNMQCTIIKRSHLYYAIEVHNVSPYLVVPAFSKELLDQEPDFELECLMRKLLLQKTIKNEHSSADGASVASTIVVLDSDLDSDEQLDYLDIITQIKLDAKNASAERRILLYEPVHLKSLQFCPLSYEQLTFLGMLIDYCMGQSQRLRSLALKSLKSDPAVGPLVPYLISYIAENVKINLTGRNLNCLVVLMRMVRQILHNTRIVLFKYLHILLPAVLTCVLSLKLGSTSHLTNHSEWSLRQFSANIIAIVVTNYSQDCNALLSRVVGVYKKGLRKPSLRTVYGATIGLATLGQYTIRCCLLPKLRYLSRRLDRAFQSKYSCIRLTARYLQHRIIQVCPPVLMKLYKPAEKELTYQIRFGGLGTKLFRAVYVARVMANCNAFLRKIGAPEVRQGSTVKRTKPVSANTDNVQDFGLNMEFSQQTQLVSSNETNSTNADLPQSRTAASKTFCMLPKNIPMSTNASKFGTNIVLPQGHFAHIGNCKIMPAKPPRLQFITNNAQPLVNQALNMTLANQQLQNLPINLGSINIPNKTSINNQLAKNNFRIIPMKPPQIQVNGQSVFNKTNAQPGAQFLPNNTACVSASNASESSSKSVLSQIKLAPHLSNCHIIPVKPPVQLQSVQSDLSKNNLTQNNNYIIIPKKPTQPEVKINNAQAVLNKIPNVFLRNRYAQQSKQNPNLTATTTSCVNHGNAESNTELPAPPPPEMIATTPNNAASSKSCTSSNTELPKLLQPQLKKSINQDVFKKIPSIFLRNRNLQKAQHPKLAGSTTSCVLNGNTKPSSELTTPTTPELIATNAQAVATTTTPNNVQQSQNLPNNTGLMTTCTSSNSESPTNKSLQSSNNKLESSKESINIISNVLLCSGQSELAESSVNDTAPAAFSVVSENAKENEMQCKLPRINLRYNNGERSQQIQRYPLRKGSATNCVLQKDTPKNLNAAKDSYSRRLPTANNYIVAPNKTTQPQFPATDISRSANSQQSSNSDQDHKKEKAFLMLNTNNPVKPWSKQMRKSQQRNLASIFEDCAQTVASRILSTELDKGSLLKKKVEAYTLLKLLLHRIQKNFKHTLTDKNAKKFANRVHEIVLDKLDETKPDFKAVLSMTWSKIKLSEPNLSPEDAKTRVIDALIGMLAKKKQLRPNMNLYKVKAILEKSLILSPNGNILEFDPNFVKNMAMLGKKQQQQESQLSGHTAVALPSKKVNTMLDNKKVSVYPTLNTLLDHMKPLSQQHRHVPKQPSLQSAKMESSNDYPTNSILGKRKHANEQAWPTTICSKPGVLLISKKAKLV